MEVDLTAYFSAEGALINTDAAEVAVARAFAAAANATHAAQHVVTASELVPLSFAVANVGQAGWDRKLKDVVLRCVDRAMGRVSPPLDVLQYLSDESPAFMLSDANATREKIACVVFQVRPSAALLPSAALKQHCVEGERIDGVQLPEPADAAALLAAGTESKRDSLLDMDLWYRARAAHQQYDASIPLDSLLQRPTSSTEESGDGSVTGALLQAQQEQRQAEKLGQLQWQLARWLTELFLNEGGWARPQASALAHNGSSSSSSSTTTRGGAGAVLHRGSVDVASRRLFQAPLRPAFPHVVDAALFSHTAPLQHAAPSTSHGDAEKAVRRQLHADVRGMEWDGLLLGYTSRYAYVAVPYYVSAGESTTRATSDAEPACVWSVVSRVPVPAFVHRGTSLQSGGDEESVKASRKRTRSDGDAAPQIIHNTESAALAQAVLARCFNVEEAMRHDKNAAATFQLMRVPHVVTVRAHRVYCARADPAKQPQLPAATRTTSLCAKKPHPAASPYKLAMMMEDAYAVAYRQLDASGGDGTASQRHWAAALFNIEDSTSTTAASPAAAMATSLHSFPDIVSVVRESCHRFVRSHERFCGIYERSLAATRQPVTAQEGDAAPQTVGDGGGGEEAGGAVAPPPPSPPPRPDLPPHAVAVQQLRLLRNAETAYASIADSTSVHFKKLRGAARVALPAVRVTADVAGLEEGYNVEFKARVGLIPAGDDAAAAGATVKSRSRFAATMDTERLRNTIAAMAACRGGVIVVGVADDGAVLGHSTQLAVAKHLRTSGFCPAMVKDAVQVKELRWREKSHVSSGDGSAASVKRAMPENWWKGGVAGTAADAKNKEAAHEGHRGGNALAAAASAEEQLVVTVVSVEKGQAPFYATAKNAPPYQRGCASTVVMPTVVVARRLMKVLE